MLPETFLQPGGGTPRRARWPASPALHYFCVLGVSARAYNCAAALVRQLFRRVVLLLPPLFEFRAAAGGDLVTLLSQTSWRGLGCSERRQAPASQDQWASHDCKKELLARSRTRGTPPRQHYNLQTQPVLVPQQCDVDARRQCGARPRT